MARYKGPQCRQCRREGMKLFLKGERCHTEKCAIEKRNFPPGQHGKDRKPKIVGYGLQLREKQRARRYYGLLEQQFRNLFEKAAAAKAVKDYCQTKGGIPISLFGEKASQLVEQLARKEAWIMFDAGQAVKNPADLKIPKP